MKHFKLRFILFSVCLLLASVSYAASKTVLLKPFTLAQQHSNAKHLIVTEQVRQSLKTAGFKILGKYVPYDTAQIFIITDKTLQNAASKTTYGGFGAVMKVSVTQVGNDVQVAHNNPSYMALAYNLKVSLNETRNKLAKALGYKNDFGGQGISSSKLPHYNYAMGLEGFTGFFELAKYKSHQEAVSKVEAGFKKRIKNIEQVYKLDIPGKDQVVYGLSLKSNPEKDPFLNDKHTMTIIDHQDLRRSAHLPYEIMVVDKRVIAMHPHFRLAINFPDLRMFGKNSFGKLMDLPYVYEEYLTQLAGGQWPPVEDW